MTNLTATPAQLARVTNEWSRLAKEPVTVDLSDLENMYAYGSEMACLRLAYAFRNATDTITVNFSTNLKRWFINIRKK